VRFKADGSYSGPGDHWGRRRRRTHCWNSGKDGQVCITESGDEMAPTLSGIRNWTPGYLTGAAAWFRSEADEEAEVAAAAHHSMSGSSWQGQGADSARSRYAIDLQTVTAHAGRLRAAAQTADRAADELSSARSEFTARAAQAEQQGFTVSESLAVTDDKYGPPEIRAVRAAYAQQHAAALSALAASFSAKEQAAAAELGGHTGALGSFAFPASLPPYGHWCKREELPADGPGDGGGCLNGGGTDRWPAHDKWGNESPGAFNDDIKVDTSHATMTGPVDPNWRYRPLWPSESSVPRDWPGLPLTGQPAIPPPASGPRPFLPNLLPSLTAPPTGAPAISAHTMGWSRAPFIPQPPVPTPSQPDPVVSPVSPIAPPDLPAPRVPAGISTPPVMTAPPPNDGYFEPTAPDPGMPPEQHPEWTVGSLLTNAGMGCAAGAGYGATFGALVPPAETILPEIGCVEGALGGAGATVLGPALNNMLNGNG
jgi:hypothetical protein